MVTDAMMLESARWVTTLTSRPGNGAYPPSARERQQPLQLAQSVRRAERPRAVGAVVSRGGRPDLAGEALPQVRSPTLLIVGSRNEAARARMVAEVRLDIVPGATHLFEEPGTLEQVAVLARDWFRRHLATAPGGPVDR
ncbi:MAG TPA: hypothetical protein VFT04_10920 [Gemmatimonadales bacterium]|nr:hypothetical protein [Gemmatimonadales bacterium]